MTKFDDDDDKLFVGFGIVALLLTLIGVVVKFAFVAFLFWLAYNYVIEPIFLR